MQWSKARKKYVRKRQWNIFKPKFLTIITYITTAILLLFFLQVIHIHNQLSSIDILGILHGRLNLPSRSSDDINSIHPLSILKPDDQSEIIARSYGDLSSNTKNTIGTLYQSFTPTPISIVISHCEDRLDWIVGYLQGMNTMYDEQMRTNKDGIHKNYWISEITVIAKCGDRGYSPKLIQATLRPLLEKNLAISNIRVLPLANKGRCDHSFAYYIQQYIRQYPSGNHHPNEMILFLKDNERSFRHYRPFSDVFNIAHVTGFACVETSSAMAYFCPEGKPNICRLQIKPLVLHNQSLLQTFYMKDYHRLDRDMNGEFLSPYSNLKEWKEDVGLVFANSTFVPVCYGGMFLTQTSGLYHQSSSTWDKLEESLSRGDNIEESHFAERSWASILSTQHRDESFQIMGDELVNHNVVQDDVSASLGMVYARKGTPFFEMGP